MFEKHTVITFATLNLHDKNPKFKGLTSQKTYNYVGFIEKDVGFYNEISELLKHCST